MQISLGKYKKMSCNDKMSLAGILQSQQQFCGITSQDYNNSWKMSHQHHVAVKNAGIVLKCLQWSMACTAHERILLHYRLSKGSAETLATVLGANKDKGS